MEIHINTIKELITKYKKYFLISMVSLYMRNDESYFRIKFISMNNVVSYIIGDTTRCGIKYVST